MREEHGTVNSGTASDVGERGESSGLPSPARPLGLHTTGELTDHAAAQGGQSIGWTRRELAERIGLIAAIVVVAAGLAMTASRRLGADPFIDQPVPARRVQAVRIDLNTAAWYDLLLLDGVGETLAHRIVAHREEHGPMLRVDDLVAVPGIGRRKLEAIRDQVSVSGTIVTLNGPVPPPLLTAE